MSGCTGLAFDSIKGKWYESIYADGSGLRQVPESYVENQIAFELRQHWKDLLQQDRNVPVLDRALVAEVLFWVRALSDCESDPKEYLSRHSQDAFEANRGIDRQ